MGSRAKNAIKRAVKRTVMTLGTLSRRRDGGTRILTYHSVGARKHEMNVTPEAFRAQMEWLAENETLIHLEDAANGRPGVAVTFDDGYRDNYTQALPILLASGIPATVFLVPGRMGGHLEHDRDPAHSQLLEWDEAREMAAVGVHIGGHTMNHARLSRLTPEQQREEIAGCFKAIKENLGFTPEAFAYPFGSAADFNATSVRLAKEAGFECAVTNQYGVNRRGANRWRLRRIWIDATDTLDTFAAKVDGRLDMLSLLDSWAGLKIRRMINRVMRPV